MKGLTKYNIFIILTLCIHCGFGRQNENSKLEVGTGDHNDIKDSPHNEPDDSSAHHGNGTEKHEEHHGIHVMGWRWDEYSTPLLFTGMIVSAVICKIIFHHLDFLSKLLPESCALILVGIIAGVFTDYVLLDEWTTNDDHKELIKSAFPKFTAGLFFNYLLPPIILDSALALYNRDFFDNVGSVLTFAVFGTLFNVFAIGLTLFGLSSSGALGTFEDDSNGTMVELKLGSLECFVFSSLISAVDPVAVLAIFEDIQVNLGLYFLVFGESLLNDGVTVVLYNAMNSLLLIDNIAWQDILMAFISFFFVVLGGYVIGSICGLFASFMTTWTRHVRVVEPLLVFCTAYFAFLAAELFHWSGIISIIGYGIAIKRYGFNNLSKKSYTTVKYAIKTIATTSDCIIFLFLGIVLIQEEHYWHPGFIIATIISCLVFRFISTYLFSWICNFRRTHVITKQEQFIMAYGGLRGAVGFSLAVVIEKSPDFPYRKLFVSTALAMVFFTVFLQGGTIKIMVKLLNIKLNEEDEGLITVDVQEKVMDDVMEGIETVMGKRKEPGCFLKLIQHIDNKLKECLIHEDSKAMLTRKFEKIILDEHFTNLYAPRILAKEISVDEGACRPNTEPEIEEKPHHGHHKADVGFAADRNMFRKGTQSVWNAKHEKRDIIKHLEMRAQRSKMMEARVLKQSQVDEGTVNNTRTRVGSAGDANPSEKKAPPPLARARSQGWMAVNRAGGTAAIIKLKYDQTQNEAKHKHPNDVAAAGHNHASIREEEEALISPTGGGAASK